MAFFDRVLEKIFLILYIGYFLLFCIGIAYSSLFLIGEILPNASLVGIILLTISILSAGLYFYASKKIFLFSVILSIIMQAGLVFLPDAHNDIYRYTWDGYASAQGENVYEVTPWDTYEKNFSHGGDDEIEELWGKTGFKYFYTTYPPTLQLIFWGSAKFFPLSPLGIKFFFWIYNLGSIFFLWKIFSQYSKKFPQLKNFFPLIILSPIFIWETTAAGHSESIFMFFLLLSIYLFNKKFFFFSAFSLSAIIWTKFFPVILIPLFLGKIFRKQKTFFSRPLLLFLGGGILSSIVLWLPFLPFDPTHFFKALQLYSSSWDMFPLFFSLFQETFSRPIASIIQLFMVCIALAICIWKNFSLPFSLAIVLLIYLLFAPAIFSWYFLWIFPLLPFLLVHKKFFFLSSLLFIPQIQYFFTVWDPQDHLFWYDQNGLLLSQKILFWGLLFLFLGIQLIQKFLSKTDEQSSL